MRTLFALIVLSLPPSDPPSAVDMHNEQMLERNERQLERNGTVVRMVMCFDVIGFLVFFAAVKRAANRSRINEERMIALTEKMLVMNEKIDLLLTILHAESTVQGHVLDQARKLAHDNSLKLDAVKGQIDANTASIISEAKVPGESGFAIPTPVFPEVL